ncbi:ThiF family adenylyltransferase [Candidatus Woesearchaeota archaeon]|nr:ThiF family adenylyltransferase [Candidatus Woesearchaeota archaeon]
MVKTKQKTKAKNKEETGLVINRYDRQELIKDWDQNKLRKASIAVIGSGPLANFTTASLVSLGFGTVELYDNDNTENLSQGEFLLNLDENKYSKVETLEEVLSKINPLVNVKGIHAKINNSVLAELLGNPDVIIDTTNDPQTKQTVLEYAQKNKIPLISASADSIKGELITKIPNKKNENNKLLEEYVGKTQSPIISEVLGGVITEEVRKIVMPFDKDDTPAQYLFYSTASPTRFSKKEEVSIKETSLKEKKVLVVGAGALGNFVSLGLALADIGKIEILDFDTVESTNLNRQLLFYDSVGQKKSKALASKLQEINPEIKVKGIDGKLDEDYEEHFKNNPPDLIIDCVDSFGTRALVNYFAVKYKIPLISGGTNPSAGQVVVYKPGESACLDCKLSVDKALAKEKTSHSCIHASQPSVIMTNQIMGGLMVAEARAVLSPENYGPIAKKMIRYDSTSDFRWGLSGNDAACECNRGSMKSWMKEIIDKHTK